ncbi:MAG TPA: hypothetical protein VJ850_03120 [Candidatus Limnocylindrales bacterium]|nr:hypothetical protein [Candidatus Limnocylindrales bacterium]
MTGATPVAIARDNVASSANRATVMSPDATAATGFGSTPTQHATDAGKGESSVSEHDLYRDNLLNPTFDVLSELPGFQGGGLEPDRDEILIYWHGEFGREAQAAVAEAKSRGVPVNVHFVPHTTDELRRMASRLLGALQAKGIKVDGDGFGDPWDEIKIWGDAFEGSADVQNTAESIAAEVLPADVKLVIVPSPGRATTMLGTRHNDDGQPTPGGAYHVDDPVTGGSCSSALGWVDPTFSPDRFYMESAAHCVDYQNGKSIYFDGNPNNAGTYSGYIGTLVGSPNLQNNPEIQLDATLIGVPATLSIAGEMFSGGNNTSNKIDIKSIGAIPLNIALCSNGAATGTNCNGVVTSLTTNNWQLCNPPDYTICAWFDLVTISSPSHLLLFGSGDSGGNVYRPSNQKVVATISAGIDGTQCGTINWYTAQDGRITFCSYLSGLVTAVSSVQTELQGVNSNLVARVRP